MRIAVFLAASVAGLLLIQAPGAAAQGTPAHETSTRGLEHALWEAEAWSHHAAGIMGWISGADGSLRLEIEHGGSGRTASLLSQTGEGWTLILGPDGNGTLNAWGREWRKVDPGLGRLAREAVGFMSRPQEGPERLRVEIPALRSGGGADSDGSGFRRSLVRRGRGRGGPGEMVILDRMEPAPDAPWAFEIRSTRRPGAIRLRGAETLPLDCPVPEVFLPLWPLAEICGEAKKNTGTSDGRGR